MKAKKVNLIFMLLSMVFLFATSSCSVSNHSASLNPEEQYVQDLDDLKGNMEIETAEIKRFYDCNSYDNDMDKSECFYDMYRDLSKIQDTYKNKNYKLIQEYNMSSRTIDEMVIFFSMLDPDDY